MPSPPLSKFSVFNVPGSPVAVPVYGVGAGGAGGASAVALRLSNTAEVSRVASWLVTASPSSTEPVARFVLPTWVHTVPFVETYPVTDVPIRVNFSHGVAWVPPASQLVAAPEYGRDMNSSESFGRTSRITSAESAAVVVRSITPAFA